MQPQGCGKRQKSWDSRTIDRVPTIGAKLAPLGMPKPDVHKAKLRQSREVRRQGGNKHRGNRANRPVSKTAANAQREMESIHRRLKDEAQQLWFRLDNPA